MTCQRCGSALYDCPTCGDLRCRCANTLSWPMGQHYYRTGTPRDSARALLERARARREGYEEAKT